MILRILSQIKLENKQEKKGINLLLYIYIYDRSLYSIDLIKYTLH